MISLIVTLLVGAAGLSVFMAEHYVVAHAQQRTRLMIMEMLAVQRYFQEDLHSRTSQSPEQDTLPAESFSVLYALETMIEYYNQELTQRNLPAIEFRIVRTQESGSGFETSAFERSLIRRFQLDPSLQCYHTTRRIAGERVFDFALPFTEAPPSEVRAGQPPSQRDPIFRLDAPTLPAGPLAGLILLQIPIESDFKLTLIVLGCSAAVVVIILALLFINHRLDARIAKSVTELRQRRLELDLAAELVHLGTWTLNLNTMRFTISPTAAALLGDPAFSQNHPTVEFMSGFLHPQDVNETSATIRTVQEGRADSAQFVYRFRTPDRGYRTFSLSSRAFVDETQTRHLVGNLIDISERVQIRRERDSLLDSLSERNQELEQYAYSVSHDLKTPLITIEGFTGLLRKALESGDREEASNALTRISNSSRKLNGLIENLLILSRLGQVANCTETVDLTAVVREALEMNEGQIERHAVKLTVEPLPEVTGDRLRLLQVFHNLIDNAVKFSYNQPEPQIVIGTEPRNGDTLIFVCDNGIGIDPRQSQEVFGLFKRLDRDLDGSGFGLTLVKRIIEAHRGRIWLESPGLGLGATFYLYLPRHSPAAPPAPAHS